MIVIHENGQFLCALFGILFFLLIFNNDPTSIASTPTPQQSSTPQHSSSPAMGLSSLQVDLEHVLDRNASLSVVVFGASGDLAERKLFPTLLTLYTQGALSHNFVVVGYPKYLFYYFI